jgi:two-component system, OmpR family, response regulator BaeR
MTKILIVEDDAKIADMMSNYLRASGYETCHVADGGAALAIFQNYQPHLVLLDVMLPTMDGIEICKLLRATSIVPIIMVTAKVEEIDRLLGLEIGADDYVCKPFSPRELVARMKALLRRANIAFQPVPINNLTPQFAIYPEEQRVTWDRKSIPLTGVEFRLFNQLYSHPGHVFGRAKLLDASHNDYRDTSDRVIDSHIKNLRKKLDAAGAPTDCIASVYGVGYRYEMPTTHAD